MGQIYGPGGGPIGTPDRRSFWQSGDWLARGLALLALIVSAGQWWSMDQANAIQRELVLQQRSLTSSDLNARLLSLTVNPKPESTELAMVVRISNAGLGGTTLLRAELSELSSTGIQALISQLANTNPAFKNIKAPQPAMDAVFATNRAVAADLAKTIGVGGHSAGDVEVTISIAAVVANKGELLSRLRERSAFALLEFIDVVGQRAPLTLWNCRTPISLSWKDQPQPVLHTPVATCTGEVFRSDLSGLRTLSASL